MLDSHVLPADSTDSSPDVSDSEWECEKQHQHAAEAVASDSSSVATYDCPVCRKPQILNLDRLQVGLQLSSGGTEGWQCEKIAHAILWRSRPIVRHAWQCFGPCQAEVCLTMTWHSTSTGQASAALSFCTLLACSPSHHRGPAILLSWEQPPRPCFVLIQCSLLALQVDAPLSKFVEDLKARQQGAPRAGEGASVQHRSGGGSRTQTVPQLPTISETLTLSLEVPAQVRYFFK